MLAVAAAWAALTSAGVQQLCVLPLDLPLPWYVAAVGTGLGLVALTALAEPRWPALRRLGTELAAAIAPITLPRVLTLAVLSGVCEEALFRGPVQLTLGWPVATVLFALVHGGGSRRHLAWTGFALLAGLAFAGLAIAYQSIWPPALAHVLVNAINMRRLQRYRLEAPTDPGAARG